MDPRDYELLRRVEAGERAFRPGKDERGDEPPWLDMVERLRRLRDQGYIHLPEPHKTLLHSGAGYRLVGPCELTANGRDALERYRA